MANKAAVKCKMCGTREMVPVPKKGEGYTEYFWCPNCDSPKGAVPKGQRPTY